MLVNPIKYISRDFTTALNDLNSDTELADKPNWFKRAIAGFVDVASMWNNATANNSFLRTAFTEQAVSDLIQLIGQQLGAHSTASGYEIFHINSALGTGIFPFTVAPADLTAYSQGNLSVSSLRFESRLPVTFSLVTNNFTTNYSANSNLTVSLDLLYTGQKIRVSSTGTLPAPLQEGLDYYVIYISSTSIKLATTLENAYAGNYIVLTSNGTSTHTLTLYSAPVFVYQQTSIPAFVTIGTSDGLTAWQTFDLPDIYIIEDTLQVQVNSVAWTLVDSFVDSTSIDKHFVILRKSGTALSIMFGDGTTGAIPGSYAITVKYSSGGGQNSNITSLNKITTYSGSSQYLSSCTNPVSITGGSERESVESAKITAPLKSKAQNRFVTAKDGETLAKAYGGLSLVKVNMNTYGLLSAQVVGIATGGGNPSPALRSAIQAYLISVSPESIMDVRFVACTITPVAVTSSAKVSSGYLWANISAYFDLAWRLFLSEAGQEIKDAYTFTGISSAVTKINSIFSKTFTTTDYAAIQKMIDILVPRNFGNEIDQSTAFAFIQGALTGVDYITITSFGTGFPQTFTTSEISTVGTLTLSQI